MFQGFLRRFSRPAVTPAFVPVPDGSGDCDLLIPVFNRPDAVRKLLASIAAADHTRLQRIWIGDDGSDAFTAAALHVLARESGLPITVIRHEKNSGFGENCRDLFLRSKAPFCIILNTDVTVPPLWMSRMLAPFQTDPRIALATPLSTNAANHTVRMRSGQHWMEADRLLAGVSPIFPDDCTAIGFCMAVNATLLKAKAMPLFDPAYGRGYGEDTDLHYRVVTAGLRSVIVDNLLVHHEGAASFSALPDYTAVREKGESAFRQKWANDHAKHHAEFLQKNALAAVRDQESRVISLQSVRKRLDILFVIPSTNERYGGIWVINTVVEQLIASGFQVGVFVISKETIISDTTPFGFAVFDDEDDMKKQVTSVTCVVSTAAQTLDTGKALAEHYKATEVLFLQCMEVIFRTGHNVETFLHYRRIQHVVTVSDVLVDYIRLVNPTVHVRRLRLGPDPLVFYPRPVQRRTFTVALAANAFPEKGTTHALELALLLRERGFHFTVYGWDTHLFRIDPAIGDILHDKSRDALAHLFSHTEFVIDQSFVEGFGLLPVEAAFCGCIPIIGSRGGAEYLFKDGENSITIDGYKDLKKALDRVQALSPVEKQRLSTNAMKLRDEYNLSLMLRDAVKEFAELCGDTGRPNASTLETYAIARL